MRSKTTLLFLALLICVISAMVFGEIFIYSHVDHECTEIGTNCLVCIKINVLKNFLKTLKMASVCFCLAVLLSCFNWKKRKDLVFSQHQFSPITLKVRINS